MSIYTQTSLKSVKKGDLVQLYLELQGKYIDIQMEGGEAAEELREVKEAANRLLTASEQQVISLKEEQDDDSESNYKYITTLEDEVEELKTERDSWRSLAKCWEEKNG
jgi:phosphoribosylformylglycinamidine (FGAM) synthase PurS component